MGRFTDLTGQKLGRLTVVKRLDNDKHQNARWLCKCDCGEMKEMSARGLKRRCISSCGCFVKERIALYNKKFRTKHGHAGKSKIYNSWANMLARCTNPNNQDYHNYGGRGIKVCQRWREFVNFLEDMGEPPTKHHTLDRIDNNQGYYKENCKWSTPQQQSRNKRPNHLETYDNKTQCVAAWAEEFDIKAKTLLQRLRRGWSIEKALITPIRSY